MTITTDSTFTTISLYSTYLEDLSSVASIKLESKINCDTKYSYTIDEDDITDGAFELDIVSLFGTTTLADSIYSFKLLITYDNGNVQPDNSCLFVDNETSCDILSCMVSMNKVDIGINWYVITRSQDCDCDCTNICILYKRMKNEQKRCKSC